MDVSTAHGPGQGGPWEGAAWRANKLKEDLEASIKEDFGATDHELCQHVDAVKGCQSPEVRARCFNLCKPETVAEWCQGPWFVLGSQCFLVLNETVNGIASASASDNCIAQAPGPTTLAQPNDPEALTSYLLENGHNEDYWLGGSDRDVEGEWRWTKSYGNPTGSAIIQEVRHQDAFNCLTIWPGLSTNSSLASMGCDKLRNGAVCESYFHYYSYIQGFYLTQ